MAVAASQLRSTDRARAVALAAGTAACCTVLAVADPGDGGYPACPTQTLLGIDCPFCGTLRGLHALLNGRVGTALDHNLLLVAAVPLAAVALALALLPLANRAPRALAVPRWAVVAATVIALAFGVVRNLGFEAVAGLGSGA